VFVSNILDLGEQEISPGGWPLNVNYDTFVLPKNIRRKVKDVSETDESRDINGE
jgi:hypothetical protein